MAALFEQVSGRETAAPSQQSLRGLAWLNFFLAGVLTGFGPFVAAYLAGRGWTQETIGFVLSIAGIASLVSQAPGGELLDVVQSKRVLVAIGVTTCAAGALIFVVQPTFSLVACAEALQGVTGGFLGPAVVAITLGLVGHDALAERLGYNQRFAAAGGIAATVAMGLVASYVSSRAIFIATAALAIPTLVALAAIHGDEIHFGSAPPSTAIRTDRTEPSAAPFSGKTAAC